MFNNPTRGLQAMGEAKNSANVSALHKVIDALKEDVPLQDMSVISKDNTRIPLDQYLSTVKRTDEMDEFFLGASQFDIWDVLPKGTIKYHSELGLTFDEAEKLVKRFNQYTWNEHEPGLRKGYMSALRGALWVADTGEFSGWRAYTGTPEVARIISNFVNSTPIYKLTITDIFRPAINNMQNLESELEKMPEETLLGFFTKKGREKEKRRMDTIERVEPLLKAEAEKIIIPLRELGKVYRQHHTITYYPEETQLNLF